MGSEKPVAGFSVFATAASVIVASAVMFFAGYCAGYEFGFLEAWRMMPVIPGNTFVDQKKGDNNKPPVVTP